jgi:hypothetical protein
MRRSLVMSPAASSGTLKSTRTRTYLPFRSGRSASVFLAMIPFTGSRLNDGGPVRHSILPTRATRSAVRTL